MPHGQSLAPFRAIPFIGLVILLLLSYASAETAGAQPDSPWVTGLFCTERVNVSASGEQANGPSNDVSLSDDGRYVAFTSRASNLVPSDSNNNWDIFLYDRDTREISRLTYSPYGVGEMLPGAHQPFLSGDGQFLTFVASDARAGPSSPFLCADVGGEGCVFLLEIATSQLEIVDLLPNPANPQRVDAPVLSANGGHLAFWSDNDDLVPEDTNGFSDVFVRDSSGGVELISVAWDGSPADAASGSGTLTEPYLSITRNSRFVAFESSAGNLVPHPSNESHDVYLRDRLAGITELISFSVDGGVADKGSYLGGRQVISDDGQYVGFISCASNIVSGTTGGNGCSKVQVYIRNRATDQNELVSVALSGGQGNGQSTHPAVSSDGRFVAFRSFADNLIESDTNHAGDIFVRDRSAGRTVRVSVSTTGEESDDWHSFYTEATVAISADGMTVAWQSGATNLVEGDTNLADDVFVRGPCPEGYIPEPTVTARPTFTPAPTSTSVPTDIPPPTSTSISTPSATLSPTAAPTPLANCVCHEVRERVPPVVVADAIANPERYYGWRYPLNPGVPPGPNNPLRECLSLQNVGLDYHPLWNKPMWRVGCP